MFASFLQDIRFGLRQLRRSPGFTLTVVGVLALGIGANSAMFTVLDGTLLRRLPYRDPSNVVLLSTLNGKGEVQSIHIPDIEAWQKRSKTLEAIAYFDQMDGALDAGAGEQDISKTPISTNLFSVLGVAPVLGRGFLPEEQIEGKGSVVILSDTLWRNLFHAAPDIVGKTVRIDDAPMTVVGVMAPHFAFPVDGKTPQIWIPATITSKQRARSYAAGWYRSVARLRAGVSGDAAGKELSGIQADNAKLYTDMAPDLTPSAVKLIGYREDLTLKQRPALLALLGAVGMVWLIACANVANLMLARSTARRREMAVRGALGASAWRLARQMMVESLLLSLSGTALGIGLSYGTLRAFSKSLESSLSTHIGTLPDSPVLLALLALSIVSALVFGVAPALLGARVPLDQTLRSGGAQAGTGRGQHRAQSALVVAEIGLCLAMLVACGLLLRTVFALRNVPLGFRTDHVYVLTPKLPAYKYRSLDANTTVYKPLLDRVRDVPEVEAATITTVMPLSNGFHVNLSLNMGKGDGSSTKPKPSVSATLKAAGPELQTVLGFQMVQGRFFNEQDTPDSQHVAVVNEAFVRSYVPDNGPLENFTVGGTEKGKGFKIVGVVKDFHQAGIDTPAVPEIDVCAPQMRPGDNFYKPTLSVRVQLAIRSSRDARSLIPDLEGVMREVNPDLRASEIETMDQVVEDAMASQLLAAHLLEALGFLALGVALAGLYSLLAYLVTLRTREFGLRMALGAAREDILSLVMRQAGWMVGGGIALGIVVSLATTQLLKHFLFGVQARDVVTVAIAAALMILVAAVAAYLPARRAAGIEPMDALRTE